jgi:hypothetical protein
MLPPTPSFTGLPHAAVPYFFLSQTYDTRQSVELLSPHGIHCPSFPTYASTIVDFAARHPSG